MITRQMLGLRRIIRGLILAVLIPSFLFLVWQLFPQEWFPVATFLVVLLLVLSLSLAYTSALDGLVLAWDKFFLKRKFRPPIRVGVLNGYIHSVSHERQCPRRATDFSPQDWVTRLSKSRFGNKQMFKVEEISVSDIGDEYAVIINPFGEVFPEEDFVSHTTFHAIEHYVRNGGIFVNPGGYAFYWHWDSVRGVERVSNPEVSAIQLIQQPQKTEARLVFDLDDRLLAATYSVYTTGSRDPIPATATQTQEDIQAVGQLADIGGSRMVTEFRSVRPRTSNAIPFLRSQQEGTYLVTAIKHGLGYLVLAGMRLDRNGSEFEKICVAIENWSRKLGTS